MEKKALLAVLAHPDDESFGPGGTLAKYAQNGIDVHIAIATDGAAGSIAEGHDVAREELAHVRADELEAAVKILGGQLHRLGYRDSGMRGDPSNQHPDAFINGEKRESIRKVVKLIRQNRTHVVLTHDETGGYFHPDHIRCWDITTAAFHAAGDPEQFTELELPPFQPQKLYYTAIPKSRIEWFVKIQRLMRRDPQKLGRNQDIDLTKLGIPDERIHAHINIRPTWEIKRQASAEHKTQGGGGAFFRFLPNWLNKRLFGQETFMRAQPIAVDGYRESDLFS